MALGKAVWEYVTGKDRSEASGYMNEPDFHYGREVALIAAMTALVRTLPPRQRQQFLENFDFLTSEETQAEMRANLPPELDAQSVMAGFAYLAHHLAITFHEA